MTAAEATLGKVPPAAPAEVPVGAGSATAAGAAGGVIGPGPRESDSAATRPAPDSGRDDARIGGAGDTIAARDWPELDAVSTALGGSAASSSTQPILLASASGFT